jgi:hypothetical protein
MVILGKKSSDKIKMNKVTQLRELLKDHYALKNKLQIYSSSREEYDINHPVQRKWLEEAVQRGEEIAKELLENSGDICLMYTFIRKKFPAWNPDDKLERMIKEVNFLRINLERIYKDT